MFSINSIIIISKLFLISYYSVDLFEFIIYDISIPILNYIKNKQKYE